MKTLAKTFGKKYPQQKYDLMMDSVRTNPVLSGFNFQNEDVSVDVIRGEFAYVCNDNLAVQVSLTYRTDNGSPEFYVVTETIRFNDGKGRKSQDWETISEDMKEFDLENDTFDDVNEFIQSSVENIVSQSLITLPGLEKSLSGAQVYLACEFDQWRSSNSRVIQGIFSTEEKAIKALTKLYGKLEKDSNGGELGFVPVNNPDDVTLQVVKATLDEVDEV